MKYLLLSLTLLLTGLTCTNAQNSVAKEWNEVNLNAVRLDRAQPTLTARNLWHVSAAMYDAWAAYDLISEPYFLGREVGGFYTPFNGIEIPADEVDVHSAREEAISYAAYRILTHRYGPGYVPEENETEIQALFDDLMTDLGFDINFTSTDFSDGNAAALGNYIAEQVIAFGIQDGSNELDFHVNQYYEPANQGFLFADQPGNPSLQDPNRWQRLFQTLDQVEIDIDPNFLSPEWGNVTPAILQDSDVTIYERDENEYKVYCDPGSPVFLDEVTDETGLDDDYKKGFMMVSVWSSLLDHTDGNMIDISPNNIGNITSYPESVDDYDSFYDFFTGTDASQGYSVNPTTGLPYEPQVVPMGDYGRVLAEFWADGPDSETPPGHWFTILNEVNSHPQLVKKWNGEGEVLDDLEWDVRTYFTLGANMHDCAIAAWSVKGWYDYIRPISAIRYMADQGQSSDNTLPNYSPSGLPLVEGFSQLVTLDDPLIGVSQENLNKVKIKAWRGPDFLDQIDLFTNELLDPIQDSTVAGVDWILAENWWPYQRPSFITPPFAGYVSGHSTFSRGAAQVLAQVTGDEYFPGGIGIFPCPQNDFLVFEEGPSIYLELQWAKYIDASDQCSLSRIFGGIHPPVDDIPGRLIGQKIGEGAFELASEIMFNPEPRILSNSVSAELINDASDAQDFIVTVTYNRDMDETINPSIVYSEDVSGSLTETSAEWTSPDTFEWIYTISDSGVHLEDIGLEVVGASDTESVIQLPYSVNERFTIDTENPELVNVSAGELINEASVGTLVDLSFDFSEQMTFGTPVITFSNQDPTINSLSLASNLIWNEDFTAFTDSYLVADADEELDDIMAMVSGLTDAAGNAMVSEVIATEIIIDTKAPEVMSFSTSGAYLNEASVASGTYSITVEFDDQMSLNEVPTPEFSLEDPEGSMTLNNELSGWLNSTEYEFVYDVIDEDLELSDIDFQTTGGVDDAGNMSLNSESLDLFNIDTKAPGVISVSDFTLELLTDENTGDSYIYLVNFDEDVVNQMDVNVSLNPNSLSLSNPTNTWLGNSLLQVEFNAVDAEEELQNIMVMVSGAEDSAGNVMLVSNELSALIIDNKNPCALVTANVYDVTLDNEGENGFQIITSFDGELNQELIPAISFPDEDPSASLTLNSEESGWFGSSYIFSYDVASDLMPLPFIDIELQNMEDEFGNTVCESSFPDYFSIELDTFLTINELEKFDILLYPNPVTRGELITINTDQLDQPDFQLIDAAGRLVDLRLNELGKLDSSGLAAGDYYLRIIDGDKNYVMRLVVVD